MIESKVPLVSVCIPVFNGEEYIGESIDSVLGQTMEDFELLVVDNCSTDRTHDIVAAYRDPRISVFKNATNLGSLGNFNRCIELSKGEFFVLLPHDDVLMPTMLDTFSKALVADLGVGLVYSSYHIIDKSSDKVDLRMVAAEDKIMSGEETIQEFILHGNPVQCAMVRKELFSSLGSFNPDFFVMSDIDMWCRIALAGHKTAYFRMPQNCFRIRSDSGQRVLIQADEDSLGILADHLGFTPSLSYIRQNTYFLLAFKYLETLFDKIPENSNLQKWRPLAADQWVLGSLIKHLIVSLAEGSWTQVKEDMNLLFKIVRWAGVLGIIPVFSRMPFTFIRQHAKKMRK